MTVWLITYIPWNWSSRPQSRAPRATPLKAQWGIHDQEDSALQDPIERDKSGQWSLLDQQIKRRPL